MLSSTLQDLEAANGWLKKFLVEATLEVPALWVVVKCKS